MKIIRFVVGLAIGIFSLAPLWAATPDDPLLPIYVDPVNGSDDNNGHTWETAMKTITNANAKTETWDYYHYRRCQVVLKKGTYVLDSPITLKPRTHITGDPSADRRETILTSPAGSTNESFISYSSTQNAEFRQGLANLTVSNVTMKGAAPIYMGSDSGTWWSKVLSNVVVTCCLQTYGSAVSSAGLYTDGRTLVTDCEFSYLTNITSYGSVAICRKGGWFKDCSMHDCYNGGYGQIYVNVNNWDPLTVRSGLEHCAFTNNYAKSSGGCFSDMPIVRDCDFYRNGTANSGSVGYWTANNDYKKDFYTNTPPEVTGCTFTENHSDNDANASGGVLSFACGGNVSNCTFTSNASVGFSGVLYNPVHVTDCTFIGNSTTRSSYAGGAITCRDGSNGNTYYATETPTVAGCTFVGNHTGGAGNGGLSNPEGGAIATATALDIAGCTFRTNASAFGAVGSSVATGVAVRKCLFEGNTAQYYGGGAMGAAEVRDSQFVNNTSLKEGGGYACGNVRSAVITNCLFMGNATWGRGGGLFLGHMVGMVGEQVVDCVISNNTACGIDGNYYGGAGLYAWNESSSSDDALTLRNLLVAGNSVTNDDSTFKACGTGILAMSRKKGRIQIENCTIVGNKACCKDQGALYVWPDNAQNGIGWTFVTNTVVAANLNSSGGYGTPYTSVYGISSDMLTKVGHSYFHPKSNYTYPSDDYNTDVLPRFKRGSYVPSVGSLLRDHGVNQPWMTGAFDLQRDAQGEPVQARVEGGIVDIGAFEYARSNIGFTLFVR